VGELDIATPRCRPAVWTGSAGSLAAPPRLRQTEGATQGTHTIRTAIERTGRCPGLAPAQMVKTLPGPARPEVRMPNSSASPQPAVHCAPSRAVRLGRHGHRFY